MTLPNHWTDEEFFILYLNKHLQAHQIRNIIDRYDSLSKFLDNTALNSFINDANLFDSLEQNEKIKDVIPKFIEKCQKLNIQMITYWDNQYPELLRNISSPPILLYIKGNLDLENKKCIAVVGTRRHTTYGKLTAERFVSYFAERDVAIVSGLAYGIDTIAHKATLERKGKTIAVVASGLDKIGPQLAKDLSNKIIDEGGAIISEYLPGTSAKPGYFPQRNRIISGLCSATLVIESGIKGGSLITAQYALEEGREVFAVPGNITSEKSQGTNFLIKNNSAIPALSPEQMFKDLGWDKFIFKENGENSLKFDNDLEQKIFDALSFDPIQIDELSDKLNMEMSQLLVSLLNLEFKGYIKELAGKNYIRNY
ncbi:MAG TPA: DNA-processing protein DprA [Candidatus Kapabacteria bacterium]|nr:DNA-processing protein DprA [Candidatus Kapabacteria bacterium]